MAAERKVFQIGFNRCGTMGLYNLFLNNGIPSIHWDQGRIALNFIKRKSAGEDPFRDYRRVVFISDMGNPTTGKIIEPFKDFRYIFEHYPDSYFILNVRNVQNWLLSRCNHHSLIEWHQNALGITTIEALLLHWAQDWHRHNSEVRAFFADKPGRLLVFDIEKDDPARISEFVAADFAIDPRHYSRTNDTRPNRKRFARLPNYLVTRPA